MPAALALAVTAAMLCKVDYAHYVLRTSTTVTAQFRPVDSGRDWPSRLAFRVHLEATGRTYWFLPWNGGTDGRQHLASTTDVERPGWHPPSPDDGPRPIGDTDYLATDASYRVLASAPERGEQAPAHILLPNLGDALWHQPTMLEPRDTAPKQFFDLVGCGR